MNCLIDLMILQFLLEAVPLGGDGEVSVLAVIDVCSGVGGLCHGIHLSPGSKFHETVVVIGTDALSGVFEGCLVVDKIGRGDVLRHTFFEVETEDTL